MTPMPRRKKDSHPPEIPPNPALNGVDPTETSPVPPPTSQAERDGNAAPDDGAPSERARPLAGHRRKPIRAPRHERPVVPFESRPDAPFDLEIEPQAARERVAPPLPVVEDRVQLPVIPLRDMVIFPHMVTQFF